MTFVPMPAGPWKEDTLIRSAGFRIAERPAGGEAIWSRGGRRYAHGVALELARREAAARDPEGDPDEKRRPRR